MGIFDDLTTRYRSSTLLVRLIYINVGIFIVLRLVALIGFLFNLPGDQMMHWVEVPSSLNALLHHPWTVFTYMFCHYSIMHILFNMLWLYWLGRIFLEYFNARQLAGLYVLGGLGGAALYLLAYATLPYLAHRQAYLIGASAAVMAIVTGVAVYAPHYRIGLLFIGDLSLKWMAIITIAIVLLGTGESNVGAQAAHIGGILVGVVYGWQMRHGHDLTAWINSCTDGLCNLFRPRRKAGVGKPAGGMAYQYRQAAGSNLPTEAEIDAILDKIKRSGWGALTDKEREILYSASKQKT